MKKNISIIVVGIVLLTAIGALWYFFRHEKAVEPSPSPIEFPIADPTGGSRDGTRASLEIPTQQGMIIVNDFLKSADVSEDPANPGYYYLGFKPSAEGVPDESPYQIMYIAHTGYFNVTPLTEPIGENRREAEAYLMELLGISASDMCGLIYTVTVPNAVNTTYSGTNLGFSFCPGAVKLP